MIYPKFIYNNALRGITPTWTGTTVAGKGHENCVDWRDFSYFQADSGTLDYTVGADTGLDSFSVYVASFTGTGAETIEIQYESAPSTFTSLQTVNPAGGKLTFDEFSSVTVLSGRKIRIIITVGTGSLLIRQLVAGEALTAEYGQYESMTYPDLLGGVKVTNNIAQNGSVLGRSIKRTERMGKIELDYLTPSWVRNTWEPFAAHMARYPFIYLPDPTNHPTVVAFTVAEQIATPQNTPYGDRHSVSFKVRHLVADELSI
jgi:hypothetical protein